MTESELLAALGSADEHLRTLAALELSRRGQPAALDACLRVLADTVDIAMVDLSPLARGIIAVGEYAVHPLLDRMLSSDPMVRLHAGVLVREISKRRFGFDGRRWPEGWYIEWGRWWRRADYRHDSPPRSRAVSVERIRDLYGRPLV